MRAFRASHPRREALAYVPVVSGKLGGPNALEIIDLRDESALYGRSIRTVELPVLPSGFGRYAVAAPGGTDDPQIFVSATFERIWSVPGERMMGSGPTNPTGLDGEVAIVDQWDLELKAFTTVGGENQVASFDTWCCLPHALLVRSEPCQPMLLADGIDWGALKQGAYGHRLDFSHLGDSSLYQTIDLGPENQMILSLVGARRHHAGCYGFAGVFICLPGLGSSVWCWYRAGTRWKATKVIDIPPEPCAPTLLPPSLAPFGVVPPLITDIKLTPNDRFLHVACWGTGELLQYDVWNPLRPRLTGTVRIGGIVQRFPHPLRAGIEGGPYSLEMSADARRIYVTNSASSILDRQFYPGKTKGWMAKFDSLPHGGVTVDDQFLVPFDGGLPQEILLTATTPAALFG
jgi:methanethiol oxidase